MDGIQSKIDFLKTAIKLLMVIIDFVSDYFPSVPVDGEENSDSKWEFYSKIN